MRLVSLRTPIAVCVMALALGQTGSAQDLQQTEQKAPRPEQKSPPSPQMLPMPRIPIPALKNIQVEITIIDQVGTEPPVRKTLNVIAADASGGAIRSKATVASPKYLPGDPKDPKSYVYSELPLNVDIRPEITEDKNRIRARLILNYETYYPAKTAGTPDVKSVVTIDQHVMLDNGKPTIVSQSADATTDRKVSVELKATILP